MICFDFGVSGYFLVYLFMDLFCGFGRCCFVYFGVYLLGVWFSALCLVICLVYCLYWCGLNFVEWILVFD